ncbi:MAG TPA: ABC transporter permease, partial [Microlunatus sp.]|nr:ABC transporter permease [Microlunatus sp.]
MTDQVLTAEIAVEEPRARGVWATVRRRVLFWLPLTVLLLMIAIAIAPEPFAGLFGNPDPRVCDLSRTVKPPTAGHPFGFDVQGCDVYANVIHGARASMIVGLVCTAIALGIALMVGTLAGYVGGLVDSILARLTDVFL